MRNLFPLLGKVYALEVMVEKRNQFDMSYSKRDGGKGGIMVYTLWLLATPQKYTIRALCCEYTYPIEIIEVFRLSLGNGNSC